MQRDIDLTLEQLDATVFRIHTRQLQVLHPGADNDGLWFINIRDRAGEVQIESTDGMCPFLIESDFSNERFQGLTVDDVIAKIRRIYAL